MVCANCGEGTDKWTYLDPSETVSTKGSRGEANMVVKCKGCKRDHSIDILPTLGRPYTTDNSGSFSPIVGFECRGVEITEYEPRMEYTATGEKGKIFEVDLTEKEWMDYDDTVKESVGIYNFESKIERAK
eukprot:TRINITY_DN6999_c0_g1_i2.p1 TRINITY_DN6999_c0_g1~~TRINITY_DN6999_c0_g1_i2.p1  ORF type:complete len:130 (+),score=23.66 TRINITY_DN6999_c0_g1_i2:148-537(+)